MSNKRLFQVFDEMNVNDEKNKTALLPCAFMMVEAKTDKCGGLVTMGVEAGIIQKLFLGDCQAVLVVFDKKEYHRLADEPVVDATEYTIKLHEARQESISKLAEHKQLLMEVLSKHESGLLPDRFIYEKIKRFLYGE